jgi:hypothetical protein
MLVIGLGACIGCFLDPINRAPVVTSIDSDGPIGRGKAASFTATASDPDSDSFTMSWAQRSGDCSALSMPPPPTETGGRFSVDGTSTTGPFCVWAFATDRYGAVGVRNRFVDPGNSPPVAMLRLVHPTATSLYPLYSTFELANDSTDLEGDTITSTWTLTAPNGSTAQLADGCKSAAAGTDVHCFFQADLPGPYKVVLMADTPDDHQSSKDTITLTVDVDRLPCILMPEPPLDGTPALDPTADQAFTVMMVGDDGDPSPSSTPNMALFNWFLIEDGVLLPVEHNYPTLPIPANQYHEGDVTKIRVEVHDRNRKAVDDVLFGCGDAEDKCAGDPQRPTCYQRVTWTVNWL